MRKLFSIHWALFWSVVMVVLMARAICPVHLIAFLLLMQHGEKQLKKALNKKLQSMYRDMGKLKLSYFQEQMLSMVINIPLGQFYFHTILDWPQLIMLKTILRRLFGLKQVFKIADSILHLHQQLLYHTILSGEGFMKHQDKIQLKLGKLEKHMLKNYKKMME